MGLKLKCEASAKTPVLEMQDGQIAVIVEWANSSGCYDGRIVQRFKDKLITLGRPEDNAWHTIFSASDRINSFAGCYVRILGKGSEFILE